MTRLGGVTSRARRPSRGFPLRCPWAAQGEGPAQERQEALDAANRRPRIRDTRRTFVRDRALIRRGIRQLMVGRQDHETFGLLDEIKQQTAVTAQPGDKIGIAFTIQEPEVGGEKGFRSSRLRASIGKQRHQSCLRRES